MIDWMTLYFQYKVIDWIIGILIIIGTLVWLWFDMKRKNEL